MVVTLEYSTKVKILNYFLTQDLKNALQIFLRHSTKFTTFCDLPRQYIKDTLRILLKPSKKVNKILLSRYPCHSHKNHAKVRCYSIVQQILFKLKRKGKFYSRPNCYFIRKLIKNIIYKLYIAASNNYYANYEQKS